MDGHDDLIWIQGAMSEYHRSREWINARIREGRLEKVGLPGDAKVYLRRTQLEEIAARPCKVEGCDEPAHRCGYCGKNSCERHGHVVRAEVTMPEIGIMENWLCDDCSDQIVEAFRQHPPKPVRLF